MIISPDIFGLKYTPNKNFVNTSEKVYWVKAKKMKHIFLFTNPYYFTQKT